MAQSNSTENGSLSAMIAEEINAALHQDLPKSVINNQFGISDKTLSDKLPSRVVVAVNGRNRPGILGPIASAIDEFEGDIRDMSQTIVGEYFTMLLVIDIPSASTSPAPHAIHSKSSSHQFSQLRSRLTEIGTNLGAHIVVMHDDILSAMHSV